MRGGKGCAVRSAVPEKKLNSQQKKTFTKNLYGQGHLLKTSHRSVDLDDLVALMKNLESCLAHLGNSINTENEKKSNF